MHCHLREPGFEHKETIETGSRSAVKGGFTTICPMPNTKPTPDNVETLKQIIQRGKEVNLCNVMPFASVTKGEKGEAQGRGARPVPLPWGAGEGTVRPLRAKSEDRLQGPEGANRVRVLQ